MHSERIESPKIIKLTEDIKRGHYDSIEKFYKEIINKGTPIVEDIKGDSNNVLVTFVYKADNEIKNVIAYGFGVGFDCNETQFTRLLDTDIWFKTYKMRNDIEFPYWLSVNDTLDKFCKDRGGNLILDPLNPKKYVLKADEENPESKDYPMSLVQLPKLLPKKWTIPRNGINQGKLFKYKLHSEILDNDRRIWVYCPFNYSEDKKPYKLLVLTDGSTYINHLSAVESLNNLMEQEIISPLVTVFIDSTKERNEELNCNEKFSRFILEEAMPFVRKKYNITDNPQNTIISGHSLGGLTACYLGFEHSEVFGNIICQSGSFRRDLNNPNPESEKLLQKYKSNEKLPLKFYLNVGILENSKRWGSKTSLEENRRARDILRDKGYKVFYEEYKSGHDFLNWGECLAKGLINLIGKQNSK